MSDKGSDLKNIRILIDEIDKGIQSLLVERAKLVKKVAMIKSSDSAEPVFYRPEREASVIKSVMKRDCAPFSEEQMAVIFRGIMSACLALEKQLRIAFLGPKGTFSEVAVIKHFGNFAKMVPESSIQNVFGKVGKGNVDMGVVPLQNSIGGLVFPTIEAFSYSSLRICGETYLAIHQCFMRSPKGKGKIQRIYSHEQSLKQCAEWLERHYSQIEQVSVNSNAYAAEMASKDPSSAAIAGENAADRYNLQIIARDIEGELDNTTRFVVIGTLEVPESGDDKTSLLVRDEGHSKILEQIGNAGVEVLHVSYMSPFSLVDLGAHQQNPLFEKIIKVLEEHCVTYKVLGSYPKAPY